MNKTHLRRSVAALATALACLAVVANPAAAVTHDAVITGGQITLTKTGVNEVVDLGGTDSCPQGTTLQVDIDATTNTIAATALASRHIHHFSDSNTYLVVLSRSTFGSPGAITSASSPHTITSLRVSVGVDIYSPAHYNATTCETTSTPICRLSILFHFSGSSTSSSSSSTYSLTGSSVGNVVGNPTCAAGPSFLLGTTATTSSAIVGHLTT